MFSGWIRKWPVNRPIREHEKEAALSREKSSIIELDPTSVVAYNSTYMEVVDRAYRQRGGWYTLITFLVFLFFFLFPIYSLIESYLNWGDRFAVFLLNIVLIPMSMVLLLFLWFYVLRKDLFCHTYYPIRFNRKTRMVYVYREERDGGILRLPWNEGFYHIGHGLADKDIIDLRCHVMDGEMVKDTFAIGLYFHTSEQDRIRGLWEQIRTYMDDGAKAAKPKYILMSTTPTWKNSYLMKASIFGASHIVPHIIFAPFMYPLMVWYWLVKRSCKLPVWPKDIEEACQIEVNDPQALPQPESTGELAAAYFEEHNTLQ